MAIRPGYFKAEEVIDANGQEWLGGTIYRTAQTAAILNSTHINARENSPDVWGDVDFGFQGAPVMANKPVPFQYVQQSSYGGLVPWELLPSIPQRNPWE